MSGWLKYFCYIPYLILCFLALSALALKLSFVALLLFLFSILYFLSRFQKTLLFLSTLFLLIIASNACIKSFGVVKNIYFRPTDEFQFRGKFRPNTNVVRKEPYGDLNPLSLGKLSNLNLIIPRTTVFKTDSLGFRNTHDYHGQKYVLIGDSFVLGVGNTQSDMLSEQLLKKYKIDTYNLASIWNFNDYYEELKRFHLRFGQRSRAFIFLFEGNDFPDSEENRRMRPITKWEQHRRDVSDMIYKWNTAFSWTPFYRYLYSLYHRTSAQVSQSLQLKKQEVSVFKIDSLPMAFYNHYAYDITQREKYDGTVEFEKKLAEIAPTVTCLVFIPTKYRVYHDWINPLQNQDMYQQYSGKPLKKKNLEHVHWNYLKKISSKLNVCSLDLTPELKKESTRLLALGLSTWWPDDTHWNKYGIAIATEKIHQIIVSK